MLWTAERAVLTWPVVKWPTYLLTVLLGCCMHSSHSPKRVTTPLRWSINGHGTTVTYKGGFSQMFVFRLNNIKHGSNSILFKKIESTLWGKIRGSENVWCPKFRSSLCWYFSIPWTMATPPLLAPRQSLLMINPPPDRAPLKHLISLLKKIVNKWVGIINKAFRTKDKDRVEQIENRHYSGDRRKAASN